MHDQRPPPHTLPQPRTDRARNEKDVHDDGYDRAHPFGPPSKSPSQCRRQYRLATEAARTPANRHVPKASPQTTAPRLHPRASTRRDNKKSRASGPSRPSQTNDPHPRRGGRPHPQPPVVVRQPIHPRPQRHPTPADSTRAPRRQRHMFGAGGHEHSRRAGRANQGPPPPAGRTAGHGAVATHAGGGGGRGAEPRRRPSRAAANRR